MLSTPSYAITIQYQATDLPDTVFGIDEWRYDYTVSDYNFAVDTGFVIYFDPLLYADLQDPAPSVNGDWDILVTQPEPLFTEEGLYDALALSNSPLLLSPFSIGFVWFGAATPGAQAFEIRDEMFNSIASGQTSSDITATPILPALFLFSSGLLVMFGSQQNQIKEKQ